MATVGSYVLPGAYNTYVQNPDATGNLIITFSRDPSRFTLPQYAQYRPVQKSTGLYLRIKADECARIMDADLADYVWPDGGDAPKQTHTEEFRYESYRATRYAYPMQLGNLAREEADWDIEGIHKAFNAQKAMTARTVKVISKLETVANWDSTHVAWPHELSDVYSWEASTSTELAIKKSLQYGVEMILKDTRGVVRFNDLQLVMSPTTARKVACSQEIVEYVKQQPSAPAIIEGTKWGMDMFGLPSKLYGIPVLLEETVRVTTERSASTTTSSFALSEGNAFLLARPGGIEAVAGGGPSFSTVTVFFKEEMTVESKNDVDNRRWDHRVVDHFDVVMTAPVSGFFFRGVTESTDSSSG
jgi:hypothetical protein